MTKMPPVPKDNRTPRGGGDDKPDTTQEDHSPQQERNLQQQGRQGNIKQNTTNQGHQQDR
jgi:hypothetical protein